jgi:hypothetical protein
MKARQLIGTSSFAPDQLRVLFEAFDQAWDAVAPSVGHDPASIEIARLKLANIVLSMARNDSLDDPGRLRDAAIQILSSLKSGATPSADA